MPSCDEDLSSWMVLKSLTRSVVLCEQQEDPKAIDTCENNITSQQKHNHDEYLLRTIHLQPQNVRNGQAQNREIQQDTRHSNGQLSNEEIDAPSIPPRLP